MKIILRGIPPSERVWSGICSNCKSVMEEMELKLSNPTNTQRDGPMAKEICPVCTSDFWMYPMAGNS